MNHHTVQGTIDNATNITEAISMLTSKYKGCTKLTIEDTSIIYGSKVAKGNKGLYEFTLGYKEESLC